MKTRTRSRLRAAVTTTLCIVGAATLAPSADAHAATPPAGASTAASSSSPAPVLTTTATWEVDRASHSSDVPVLREGDRVHVVVTVTNTTGSPVDGLALVGTGTDATCDATSLAPGAATTCRSADRRIDGVDARIGAVTLSVRTEGSTPDGLLVRSAPSDGLAERMVTALPTPLPRSDTPDRTAAAVCAAGVLAALAALTGAIAGHLNGGRRARPRLDVSR